MIKKRTVRIFMIILLLLCTLFFPITTKTVTAKHQYNITLRVGQVLNLRSLLHTKKLILWKSSNPQIAEVDLLGIVKAKKIGKVRIAASYKQEKYTLILHIKEPNLHNESKVFTFRDKYISILGDSISTLKNYSPEDYRPYYHKNETKMTDTWWGKVITELGARLLVNNSYSGGKVSGNHISAFNRRCICLNDSVKNPDIIFFYGGTNDYLRRIPIGTLPVTKDPHEVETFSEAYALTLKKLQRRYPHAKIYCLTILMCNSGEADNRYLKLEQEHHIGLCQYNEAIKSIAASYHIEVIDINQCGITYDNLSEYMVDYNQKANKAVHPNKAGHQLIANYILKQLTQ